MRPLSVGGAPCALSLIHILEGNRLYIPSVDTYVTLTAYDGGGNLLQGEWFYDWNGESGRLVLNAVPEPAAVAAILGASALAFAARRRRD